jgi:formylglycine-generating enzyme required for sulfatase activity
MPNTEKRLLKAFLCHASEDKPRIRQLFVFLRKNGVDAWLDEENLLAGQQWQVEIPKAIRASDVIIVCLSKGSITKEGYIQKEIRSALDIAEEKPDETIFIIPVRLEECAVPTRLSQWHWLDLFGERGGEKLIRSLEKRAEGLDFTITRTPLPDVALALTHRPSAQNGMAVSPQKETIFTRQKSAGNQVTSVVWGGIEFVKVPAGEFIMGNKLTFELADQDETPMHMVNIPYEYWIGRFPITNVQFAEFVEWTHYEFDWVADWMKKLNHPVVDISWSNALVYLNWLNKSFGNKLPKGLTFRLPTEAEWEKAARGTDGRQWPWGNEFDKNKCNSYEGGKNNVMPVGAYSPAGDSPYGAAEMSGNVWEWTCTNHRLYPYVSRDGRDDLENDHQHKNVFTLDRFSNNTSLGPAVVLRGGSYKQTLKMVRAAYRERRSWMHLTAIKDQTGSNFKMDTSGFLFEPQGLRVVVGPKVS